MKYLWNFLAFLFLWIFLAPKADGQINVYIDHTGDEGLISVCAWESVKLFDQAGQPKTLGKILFGEELTHLGQEALVKDEKKNYILVKNKEGKIGWVNETYLVKDAGLVVVLDRIRLYENAGSYSSAKDDYFEAGELAILNNYKGDWIYLVGKKKSKSGWIRGLDILSADEDDISIASMLDKARRKKTAKSQIEAMKNIGQTRGFLNSRLAPIIKEEIRQIALDERDRLSEGEEYLAEADEFKAGGEDDLAAELWYLGDGRGADVNELNRLDNLNGSGSVIQQGPNYRLEAQEVVDFATNRTLMRYRETGTIAPVKAKRPPSIYYAYHKTLAKGSKVLLEVPGTDKYVELTILAKLRKDNKHMIGLDGRLLQAVYGESQAKNVPSATIIYYPVNQN